MAADETETRRQKARKSSRVFNAEGKEVLISLLCPACRKSKPLGEFGLRKMPDGTVRNQPRCRRCRGVSTKLSSPAPTDLVVEAPDHG